MVERNEKTQQQQKKWKQIYHRLVYQKPIVSETTIHLKPSETTGKHSKTSATTQKSKPFEITWNYLQPTQQFPKSQTSSSRLPKTAFHTVYPATNCGWLILSYKLLEEYTPIFSKQQENDEYFCWWNICCCYCYHFYHKAIRK